MANRTLVVSRSDVFPVGTVVKAYPLNRVHGGKPAGASTAEATVDAAGKLTLTNLVEGMYRLWALVSEDNRTISAANAAYTAPGTLKARLKVRREAVGAPL